MHFGIHQDTYSADGTNIQKKTLNFGRKQIYSEVTKKNC